MEQERREAAAGITDLLFLQKATSGEQSRCSKTTCCIFLKTVGEARGWALLTSPQLQTIYSKTTWCVVGADPQLPLTAQNLNTAQLGSHVPR